MKAPDIKYINCQFLPQREHSPSPLQIQARPNFFVIVVRNHRMWENGELWSVKYTGTCSNRYAVQVVIQGV